MDGPRFIDPMGRTTRYILTGDYWGAKEAFLMGPFRNWPQTEKWLSPRLST